MVRMVGRRRNLIRLQEGMGSILNRQGQQPLPSHRRQSTRNPGAGAGSVHYNAMNHREDAKRGVRDSGLEQDLPDLAVWSKVWQLIRM